MKKGVLAVLTSLAGAAAGAVGVGCAAKKKTAKAQQYADKHLALFLLMNQWVKVKQDGKDIPAYLIEQGYKKIAIYGMSYVGETLYHELEDSPVEVAYAIDKRAEGMYADVELLSPDDELPDVDAVIVTPVFFFDEIEEMLASKMDADIVSMEDILYEV